MIEKIRAKEFIIDNLLLMIVKKQFLTFNS